MNILVKVGTEQSENLCRRKGKGSLALFVSQGLVDPNLAPSGGRGKGKWLIFHYYFCMRGDTSLFSDASG